MTTSLLRYRVVHIFRDNAMIGDESLHFKFSADFKHIETEPLPLPEAEALRDQLQAAALANGHSLSQVRYSLEVAK